MLRSWFPAATARDSASCHAEHSEASPSARRRAAAALTQSQTARLTLTALTLGGFALRLGLLAAYPLREDEAIYAFWARRWLDGDYLFMHVWPDKPPLFLWLLAGLFGLAEGGGPAGATAAVGRWLGIAAGPLTIPMTGLAARRLWDSPRAGVVAGLLVALSPFAVSFSPTLYTDPLLVLWGSAAVAAALWARPGLAGALLGAACMTKQQGALYAPLVLALALLPLDRRAWTRLGRALLGLALVTLPILGWDSLRWTSAPSPWELAARTYAPLAVAPPATWGPRLAAWGGLLWYLTASWPVWVLLAAAGTAALWRARHAGRLALVLGWGVAFVAVHGLTTVQVWDRYLLPLAPWVGWVAGGPLALMPTEHLSFRAQRGIPLPPSPAPQRDSSAYRPRNDSVSRWLSLLPLAALLLLLTPPALTAATGGYPLGGDHGDYAGLDAALAWLDTTRGPYVLYHQPLGWQYRFYLYDDLPRDLPGDTAASRVDLRWFPSAVYLADNAAKTPYPPKFVVMPDWAPLGDLDLHLAQRGLAAAMRLRAGHMTVLEIVHTPQPPCAWCATRVPWTPRLVASPSPNPARMCLP